MCVRGTVLHQLATPDTDEYRYRYNNRVQKKKKKKELSVSSKQSHRGMLYAMPVHIGLGIPFTQKHPLQHSFSRSHDTEK